MQTVSDRTLTAANSILLMRVKGFNDNFVQIEGYAADNAFDFGQGKIGETMMGVDGQQSGGFTPYEVDFNIQLAPHQQIARLLRPIYQRHPATSGNAYGGIFG